MLLLLFLLLLFLLLLFLLLLFLLLLLWWRNCCFGSTLHEELYGACRRHFLGASRAAVRGLRQFDHGLCRQLLGECDCDLPERATVFGAGLPEHCRADFDPIFCRLRRHRHSPGHQAAGIEAFEGDLVRVKCELKFDADDAFGAFQGDQFNGDGIARLDLCLPLSLISCGQVEIERHLCNGDGGQP